MLSKELEEAIVKSLPAQTAGVLKTRLDLIDSLEDINRKLNADCLKLRDENKSLEAQIKNQNSIQALASNLEAKERGLEKRERDLEKTILETKLESEKAATQKVFNLVDMVFRNKTTVRYETTNVPVFTPYAGGGGYYQNQPGSSTSEEREEIR